MRKTKRLCFLALLTAAALCMFILEAQLPPLTTIPGIKPGLSNIFTLVACKLLGPGAALALLVVRVVLGCLITGQVSARGYSLCGGLLSWLLLLTLRSVPQFWAVSMCCGAAHNLGQLILAVFVLGSAAVLWYTPVLILSGMIAGLFTGLVASLIVKRLQKSQIIQSISGDDAP